MSSRTNGIVIPPIVIAQAFGRTRLVGTSLNRAPKTRMAAVWSAMDTPRPLMMTPMPRAFRRGR